MGSHSLKGETALITGAARRLGRAVALALAEEGVNLVLHYRRSADEADALRRELAGRGVASWALQADFEDPQEAQELLRRARDAAGPITILLNNAAIFPPGRLGEITLDDLQQSIRVNAWAPLVLSREFARQTERGKIVNLLDARIHGYDRLHVSYHLSKHMLGVLTRMTALEFAPNITVNAVAPGLILPPEGEDESYLERLKGTSPLGTWGDPADVADAVLYLLKSTFVTGQIIYVDGGRHLRTF